MLAAQVHRQMSRRRSPSLPRCRLLTLGSLYNTVIEVSGGSSPYNFSVRSGKLPPGLGLNSKTGTVSGSPKATGKFLFVISVVDRSGRNEGIHRFLISVNRPTATLVRVSPAALTLASGATQQFTAVVSNSSNHSVEWSASADTVSSAGLFIAPKRMLRSRSR
jgi:hypothetical protein